jgi:hypothetical protein
MRTAIACIRLSQPGKLTVPARLYVDEHIGFHPVFVRNYLHDVHVTPPFFSQW